MGIVSNLVKALFGGGETALPAATPTAMPATVADKTTADAAATRRRYANASTASPQTGAQLNAAPTANTTLLGQ